MNKTTPIGFYRRVRLEWLGQTAEMVLAGKKPEEIRTLLTPLLTDSGEKSDSGKTLSILLRIWAMPPAHLKGLHQDGLKLVNQLPVAERLTIHWGMSMAVYPFFGQVAATVGKLLRLQNNLNMSQVQRRMCEQLGESETVARATHRVVRSFVDWSVLADTKESGIYHASTVVTIQDPAVTAWLLEAQLISTGSKTGLLKMLADAPSLYPFKIANQTLSQLETNPRLELFHQGSDQNLVSLCAS